MHLIRGESLESNVMEGANKVSYDRSCSLLVRKVSILRDFEDPRAPQPGIVFV